MRSSTVSLKGILTTFILGEREKDTEYIKQLTTKRNMKTRS